MILNFISLLIVADLVYGGHSPVLIWSPSRSLKDLPQGYAGQTISAEKFQNDYMAPLTSDSNHNTVIFLQDKLSLEDFTHHADVYNPSGDGGAFKNIKSAMDDQFSVHLSAVKHPQSAIDTAVSSFPGEVHRVDNSEDLETLDLEDGKSHLIIVTLSPTRGRDEATAFATNDAMMGRCMRHLNKRGIKYSALYTAKSDSQVSEESVHPGRRLLEDKPSEGNGTFQNLTEVLVFLKGVNLTVNTGGKKEGVSEYLEADDSTLEVTASIEDKALEFDMTVRSENVTLKVMMTANETYAGEWMVMASKAAVTGKAGKWDSVDAEVDLKMDMITAPYGFGFHCTRLGPVLNATSSNATDKENATTVSVTLMGFQFEPFYNHSGEHFGSDNWDCVGFFTTPIWMAIISTIVLVTVLFFGLTMISEIKTMDRFDDPKRKTITINVSE